MGEICLAKYENKEIKEAESNFTVIIVFMGKIIKWENIFQEITSCMYSAFSLPTSSEKLPE